MSVTKTVAVLAASGLVLVGTDALAGVATAGASTEPPPVILHNPRSRSLHVGASATFRASAEDAATVLWVVGPPDHSTFTVYSGVDRTSRRGVLRSTFTFGPFEASENGWLVSAAFINDPTGVPSGVQESDTVPAVMTLRPGPGR